MLGLLWYLQRKVGRRQQRRRDGAEITVLGRQSLGSKAQLVVVEAGDARYVLGVTEHGVNLIERMPADHVKHPVVHSADGDTRASADQPRRSAFDQLLAEEEAAAPELAVTRQPGGEASAHGAEEPTLRRHLQSRAATRASSKPDPLRGSILSPQTWRQTAEFMRRVR